MATGTLVVTAVPQVVAVQLLPALAATGAHEGTPVGPTTKGAGQVVVVKLFAAVAPLAVHVATGTLVVTMAAGQVVVV